MIYPFLRLGCRFGNVLFCIASAYNHSKQVNSEFGIAWDSHPVASCLKYLLNYKDFGIKDLTNSDIGQKPVYENFIRNFHERPPLSIKNGGVSTMFGSSYLFRETEEDIKKLYAPLTKPTIKGTLGIHVRLGDYCIGNNKKKYNVFNVPLLAYALTKTSNKDIHLFSDSPEQAKDMLDKALHRTGIEANVTVHNGTYIDDFADLTSMEELILSASTYSWWAGYLSKAKNIVIHADWLKVLAPACADCIFEPNWRKVYFSEIDPVFKKKIAIIFIGLGKYIMFWREFYESLNKYFCVGIEKHFFAFSDAPEEHFTQENVTHIKWEKKGWPHDSECRFKCILSIADTLVQYDYVCFANANLYATKPIMPYEVLPRFGFENWTCMMNPYHDTLPLEKLPVDRQYNSSAFMRIGWCKLYIQAGFYIATPYAMFDMAQTCQRMLDVNTENGYVARWHDESYFNKYIVNYPKRLIGREMINAEEFLENEKPPLVLINKRKLGQTLTKLRQ